MRSDVAFWRAAELDEVANRLSRFGFGLVPRCGVSAHVSRPPSTTKNASVASLGRVRHMSPWVAGARCGGTEVNCDGNQSSLVVERRPGATWNADVRAKAPLWRNVVALGRKSAGNH